MTKVIVVGAGQWGKNLVRTFYELGALAGVAEAHPELRNRLKTDYPEVPLYEDYRSALTAEAQAFVIATPAHTHAAIARKALLAGKDIFVEKPLTLSADEAEELVLLAEEKQRILMVGHLLLYQPAIRKMKEMVDQGRIGKLRSLHQERMKLGRVRAVENVLWSFGVHDLAVFLYLVGESPKDIQATGQRIVQPAIEDDVYVHLTFTDSVTAHLHTSWLWPQQRRCLTIIGTTGMLVYDEEVQTVTLHRKGIDAELSNVDEGSELVFKGEAKPLTLECKHFLECVDLRRRPLSDGTNGVEVVRILEKASDLLRGGLNT
ncbi:Gfo/Idh/MocA family protein [Cohnella suwonensis]|uniref:Gfo/Idh/MocA family protein n=1 Tax=Cohnella suwonensis TaxID=696072 RepID=A0ABW0LVB6_9BACL